MFDHAYGKTQGHEFAHLATKRTTQGSQGSQVQRSQRSQGSQGSQRSQRSQSSQRSQRSQGHLAPVIFERPSGQIGVALEKASETL